jgi:hypothetical protein
MRWIAIAVGVCAVTLGAWFAARQLAGPTIRRTHTEFLFTQFDQAYADFLRARNAPAGSQAAFYGLVSTWQIDWNSCEFRDGQVVDSWGTPVQTQAEPSTIRLRSAGPDRRFNTPDDIEKELGKGPAA